MLEENRRRVLLEILKQNPDNNKVLLIKRSQAVSTSDSNSLYG